MFKHFQRLLCQRRCTLTRAITAFIFISLAAFGLLNYYDSHLTGESTTKRPPPPTPHTNCIGLNNRPLNQRGPNDHRVQGDIKIGRRVLIVLEYPLSKNAKTLVVALESARFTYKIVTDKLPALTHLGRARYGVVIFETIDVYLNLNDWNRQSLDKYCFEYKVGMIFFVNPPGDRELNVEKIPDFSLTVQYNLGLKHYRLNPNSDVWRITKPGEIISETFQEKDWAVFHFNDSTFEPLALASQTAAFYDDYDPGLAAINKTVYPAILDNGKLGGIRRIFFGQDLSFWLHSLMLMDSISYLSYGTISLSLERYIQIDIDDIFVGAIGTRMKAEDVVVKTFKTLSFIL